MAALPAERRARILGLAVPIIGGMISQNVLNLVDMAMVRHLGDPALAGVGLGSFANFMAMAFIMGMAAGVQAMAARRRGEGRTAETALPLNGGLLLAAAIGLPTSLVLAVAAPWIMDRLAEDPVVATLGADYLGVRLLGMAAVGMNFAFRGYWNAVDRARLYLRTLIIMHATNIALGWVFIYGHFGCPALGVYGAGLATALSTWVGTGIYFHLGRKHAKENGFLAALPSRAELAALWRLSVPAGLQQFFFATGMTVFFTLVGLVGTRELAASNVLVNLLLVAVLPGVGFGLAAATLVGQALGSRARADAQQWGYDVVRMAGVVLALLAVPALLAPEAILMLFVKNPVTREAAAPVLQLMALLLPLDALGTVLMNALLGAGDSRTVMRVAVVTQWVVQLPLVWLVGPVLGGGLVAIWLVWLLGRAGQALVFWRVWRGEHWGHAQV